MLVGSQLKNAQLETVADVTALNLLTDLVPGRIVYVKNPAQLYIYDDGTVGASGWKPIDTTEDSLALLNAKSDQITGGSGGAAPTRTVNAIETQQDTQLATINTILDGTATFTGTVGVNGIVGGEVSLLDNKKIRQEMCLTFRLNGVLPANDSFTDGFQLVPFDHEITGISAYLQTNGAGTGHTEWYIERVPTGDAGTGDAADTNGIHTTKGKFQPGNSNQAMMVTFLDSSGDVSTGGGNLTAVDADMENDSGSDVLPVLKDDCATGSRGDTYSLTIAGGGTAIRQNLTVCLFIRRRNLAH